VRVLLCKTKLLFWQEIGISEYRQTVFCQIIDDETLDAEIVAWDFFEDLLNLYVRRRVFVSEFRIVKKVDEKLVVGVHLEYPFHSLLLNYLLVLSVHLIDLFNREEFLEIIKSVLIHGENSLKNLRIRIEDLIVVLEDVCGGYRANKFVVLVEILEDINLRSHEQLTLGAEVIFADLGDCLQSKLE